jgi:ribosomal protein L17
MKDLDEIIKNCCMVSGVDITRKNRKVETYVYGRACYYVIAKQLKKYKYIQKIKTSAKVQKYTDKVISKYIGWNHASGINARKKITASYYQDKVFTKMLEDCLTYCVYMLRDEKEELQYTESQVQELRLEIKKLIKQRNEDKRLIENFTSSTNGFLLEINQLPEDQRNEFRDVRWMPYKRMLESRVKYKN